MAQTWMDDTIRHQLEQKREVLKEQLKDLETVLNGRPAAIAQAHDRPARVVRAGRQPLSVEAKKRLSKRMKAVWAARKAKQGAV